MFKKVFKHLTSVLLAVVLALGFVAPMGENAFVTPVEAAGYGKINAKASAISVAPTGGGDFILKQNTVTIKFKMKKACDVRVYVMDSSNKIVYYKDVADVAANKVCSIKWNGKQRNGKYVSFSSTYKKYRVCVRAGKTKNYSSYFKLYKKSDFAGGVGSDSKPYQIRTAAQLAKINEHPNRSFILTEDIDYNYSEMPMIVTAFSGNLDGDGHSIKNAMICTMEKDSSIAMFSTIAGGGVVQNITFEGCSAIGTMNAALVTLNNDGIIMDCIFKKCKINSGRYSATICDTNNGEITDCFIYDTVIAAKGSSGSVSFNNGKIISIMAQNIDVTAGQAVWNYGDIGIVAYNNKTGIVMNCVASGICDRSGVMVYRNDGIMQDCWFNSEQKTETNYGIIK